MSESDAPVDEATDLAIAYERVASELLFSIRGFTSRGGPGHALQLVTLGLLAKGVSTVRAVLALMSLSLIGEAQILLRTLVELAVTLDYIFESAPERAQLYLDFQHIAKWRELQRLRRLPNALSRVLQEQPNIEADLEKRYAEHKSKYLTRKGRVQQTWHAEKTAEMARAVGVSDVWEAMYPVDSGLVHSGPDALQLYLRQAPNGALEILPSMPAHRVMRVLCDTMYCLGSVARLAAQLFGSGETAAALSELDGRRGAVCRPILEQASREGSERDDSLSGRCCD